MFIKNRDKGLLAIYASFVLSVVLCVAVFAGITYAWFNATVDIPIQNIEMADYQISEAVVTPTSAAAPAAPLVPTDGIYSLAAGTYTLDIKATGTSVTGHFILTVGEEEIHTAPVKGGVAKYTLTVVDATTLKIDAAWGNVSGGIENGSAITK